MIKWGEGGFLRSRRRRLPWPKSFDRDADARSVCNSYPSCSFLTGLNYFHSLVPSDMLQRLINRRIINTTGAWKMFYFCSNLLNSYLFRTLLPLILWYLVLAYCMYVCVINFVVLSFHSCFLFSFLTLSLLSF